MQQNPVWFRNCSRDLATSDITFLLGAKQGKVCHCWCLFSPLLCASANCFVYSVVTFARSFLLSLRLLSVFIKMKGRFDVWFWSPGWPNHVPLSNRQIYKERGLVSALPVSFPHRSKWRSPPTCWPSTASTSVARSAKAPLSVSEGWSVQLWEVERDI